MRNLAKTIVLSLLIIFLSASCAKKEPALVSIWGKPATQVKTNLIKNYKRAEIQIEELNYPGKNYKNQPASIFGYLCYPETAKKKPLPAILVVHGGGGHADLKNTVSWAQRGYVVMSIDLPGTGEGRSVSKSTGPNMDVPIILGTKPNLADNYLIHATMAIRNAITILTQRPEVDQKNIGLVGLSWGGVLSLITNGLDTRLKTVVNVFGAGYIPEACAWQSIFDNMPKDELANWNNYIDPKNFTATQHAPILFITGTNDHCYYLPTVQKTYLAIDSAKKLLYVPNLRHKFPKFMENITLDWFDKKLKNQQSFPSVKIHPGFFRKNKVVIKATAYSPNKIDQVNLYYAQGGASKWTIKKWQKIPAYEEAGVYYFGIPQSKVKPAVTFFVNAKDKYGATSSSLVRSIFKTKLDSGTTTFSISSPIKKVYVHEPPLQVLGFEGLSYSTNVSYSRIDNCFKLD